MARKHKTKRKPVLTAANADKQARSAYGAFCRHLGGAVSYEAFVALMGYSDELDPVRRAQLETWTVPWSRASLNRGSLAREPRRGTKERKAACSEWRQ